MRLVRLDDLSEEERKKALEEQQERLNKNRQESQNIQNEANQNFNNYVSQNGAYDTNKNTTTIGDLRKAYRNTPSYNNVKVSTNELYKNNKASIWEQVKSIANGLGKNIQNMGLGIDNGISYFRQQLERNTRDNAFNNAININNDFLQEQLNKNPNNEKSKSMLEQNNKYINNIKNEQNNYQNKLKEKINNNNEKIQKNADSIDNSILKKSATNLAPAIGQMIPSFTPGFGAIYASGSASGQYYEDAKQRGMNDEEAQKYSGIMGLMEGTTEMIGIENLSKAGKGVKALIKGTGKEAVKEGTKEITKSGIKTVLKNYGISIADNIMQEAIIDPIQELTAQTIAGKDKAQWEGIGQKMLQDGINGGLVSAILGGANLGIQSCTGIVEKMYSNQRITGQEVQKAVKEAGQQLDTSKMMMDSVEQQVSKYKDYYTGKQVDSNTQDVLNQAQNIIDNNQNLQQNTIQNQFNSQEQQIIPLQDKNTSKSNMTERNNTKNTTIKDFNESAKQYNIDYKNEDLQEIKQMFEKREINAYFDENTFQNNNDAFSVWKPTYDEQGNISGREVVFNPNAQDTNTRVQELAIHELGHDLDLNEVQNMILKDVSRKENWESARKSLENTYKHAYENDNIQISDENFNKIVDEEATMSILQRELGSQEYVNRLVNQNQSVAKKIYNWVIDKLNKFTGGKNEKLFWTDIRNKFETAYSQEFSKNEDLTKFSIAGRKSLDNIRNDNYLYNSGINAYDTAQKLAKQNIDNEQIRQRTGWFQDKNGDWKYEFSDRDMELKNIKLKSNKTYKLGDILKHDTLFELYPQIKNYNVEFMDNIKANGVFDRKNNIITINSKLIQNTKAFEGTLIHEIQHTIQNIEKFERGASPRRGKLKYYNSLGEIEATETKERFLAEKYKNKDISKIAPESSKVNPQHKNLNTYLKNRNLLDKIRDGLYNYIDKKGGNNYEIFEEMVEENSTQNNSLVDGRERRRYVNEEVSNEFNKGKQKYALPIKDWQQFLEDNYQKQGTGKSLKEYNLPTKEDIKTKLNLPTKENINTQGERINWNDIERPEGKIRKHYRSIIESNNTTKEAKAIAKELMGTDTYVPDSNQSQIKRADNFIEKYGVDKATDRLMTNLETDNFTYDSLLKRVGVDDIALGERLIQYYSKTGDAVQLQNVIQATAMAGTEVGRAVQAFSILNHQTPEGQATWIQRSVDKMNNELAKKKGGTITKDGEGNVKVINKLGKDITDKVDLFNLTPDMIEKVINSKDKQTMYENIDSVYEELGSQVPKSTIEKIDSWRYFSMLANPRTHIRNMFGNFAMGKMQRVKDKLAGGIEDVVGTFNKDMERTKTLRLADEKTKNFAKNDVLNTDVQSMMELNENKYNPQSRLQNARKTFKNDVLENTLGKLFDWNDKALEAEDALGLKSAYKKALTDYLTANKIDTDKITDAQLSKARSYAVQQAKEATFHQANSIATAINQFSRKNKLTKGGTDAVLPFVKTPLNVAKSGLEYNPTGLLKTITVDTVKLRKGDITVNKYIDNLSKGLTGTGIAVLGYALADAGILKASGGDDDKKESYDEALGKQSYSIQINGKTFSLDWLAPAGIPLFTGAEAYSIKNTNKNEKNSISSDDNKKENQLLESLENWANGMAKSISPMSEMSMISGLTSALSSYSDDKLSAIGTNAVKSYVNQFVPTLLGQVAKTTDDYERSTTTTKTDLLQKSVDQTKLQMMSKIPGLRQKLPTKADIWGNEQKSEPIIPLRVINNFINPATVKNINTSKVDEELNNLYSKIGEATILPSTIDKKYTINGQNYRMTNDEYAKYKKDYGQTSYKLLDGLINSKDYNNLDDEQKKKAIETVYSYAKMKNKVNYANNENETVETKTIYNTLEELEQKGGDQSAYLGYVAKTKDITGEGANKQKIGVLANSDYSDKTKEIIYKNTEGSNDKKIILVDKLKLPINEYLNYKSQKFENDKDSDGETISGSKKQKVYNYLDSLSDEELSQDYKKIICKIEGINDYDNDIVNFVNNSKNLNYSERTEILKNIGFKIDKDGKIQTKSMIPIYKYVK